MSVPSCPPPRAAAARVVLWTLGLGAAVVVLWFASGVMSAAPALAAGEATGKPSPRSGTSAVTPQRGGRPAAVAPSRRHPVVPVPGGPRAGTGRTPRGVRATPRLGTRTPPRTTGVRNPRATGPRRSTPRTAGPRSVTRRGVPSRQVRTPRFPDGPNQLGRSTARPGRTERLGRSLKNIGKTLKHLDPGVLPTGVADGIEHVGEHGEAGVPPKLLPRAAAGGATRAAKGTGKAAKNLPTKAWDAVKRATGWFGGQVNDFSKTLDYNASKLTSPSGAGGLGGGLSGGLEGGLLGG